MGFLWALPGTVVGLVLYLCGIPLAWPRWHKGALELRIRHLVPRMAVAQTWGFAILLKEFVAKSERIGRHERVHVAQWKDWGPVFFLAYPIASLVAWLRTGRGYEQNAFEVAARERE